VWRYDISKDGDQSGFHGRFLLTPELVIVATDGENEGFVYAFEQSTGDVRWKHDIGRPAPSGVVRNGDLIYANTQGDSVVALELATGAVRWRFAPAAGPRFGRSIASPTIAGERVVIAGGDGIVYALNARDGRIEWQTEIGAAMTSPVVARDLIYLGIVSENRVIALSADSGSRVNEAHSSGSVMSFVPPVAADRGLAAATDATLELWTAGLGRLRWQARAPAKFGRSPVLWNDKLIGGTVRGHVLGYQTIDGRLDSIVQLKGVVTGLAGFDDVLYVGTQEGILYAVRP